MKRVVMSSIVSVLVVTLGQPSLAQNPGPTELERERFIRIVEPVIYPMQRLQGELWSWSELRTSCGIGHGRGTTELGQALIRCEPDKPQRIGFHGGNEPERIWANMIITVTVKGFNTHEKLCWVRGDDHGAGDVMKYCDDKKPGTIKPVVVARFTMKTTLIRYDEKEAKELTAASLRLGQLVTSAGILEPRRIEAGEVKSREVVISPIKYEFPNGK